MELFGEFICNIINLLQTAYVSPFHLLFVLIKLYFLLNYFCNDYCDFIHKY